LSSKYDKITNYNLSYEILRDAVNEFNGYVLGLSQNDIWLFLDSVNAPSVGTKDAALDSFLNDTAVTLLDRTAGAFFCNDLITNKKVNIPAQNFNDEPLKAKALFTFVPPNFSENFLENDFIQATRTHSNAIITTKDMLKYYEGEISEEIAQDKDGNALKDSDGNEKMFVSGIVRGGDLKDSGLNNKSKPDRFNSPSLGSIVIQHPKASIASRGKEHLPIFFNAVTPIEMSRCVPYIDLRVVSLNYRVDETGEKIGASKLNNVSFMRFLKGDSRKFELDDAVGFGNLKPVNNSTTDAERKASVFNDISFMDLFTAPQTLANANINSNGKNGFATIDNVNNPILEPIAPFLTLESLIVNVTGTGYGALSSKKGVLKLKLHDRSRLKDMSPLLSSSRFATNKIIIEFGWNHPDGGPFSDNPLGKYLNALKERSVFQVTKADFSFGDGGVVDITIGLAAYGFRQTERVHAGAGPDVPMNFLSDIIDASFDDLLEEDNKLTKAPEIRQKVKLNQRSARSDSSSISWETYKILMTKTGNLKNMKEAAIIVDAMLTLDMAKDQERPAKEQELKNLLAADPGKVDAAELQNIIDNAIGQNKSNMIGRVYGKLEAIKDKQIPDPFISSLVYPLPLLLGENFHTQNAETQNKQLFLNCGFSESDLNPTTGIGELTTLGKLINYFIGMPLAASCLYDEVQLVFYPMNHQAAGGRKHTTASFPIQINKLEEAIKASIKRSPNLSVTRMFSLLEKLVADRNCPAYGISGVFAESENMRNSSSADQAVVTLNSLDDLDKSGIDEDIQQQITELSKSGEAGIRDKIKGFSESAGSTEEVKLKKALTSLIKQKKSLLNEATKAALPKKLRSIYRSDGLQAEFTNMDRFVRPNIAMDFEVIDAIDAQTFDTDDKPGFFKKLYRLTTPSSSQKDGLYLDKTILRIHVYDEECVQSPSEHTLINSMTQGVNNKVSGGAGSIAQKLSNKDQLTYQQVKEFVKRAYPTIIYGAAGSTISNISIDSNTSGGLANVTMIESYANARNGDVKAHRFDNNFESIEMFPQTINISMMGIPTIGIGNSIFIDFGTNTSLDNIYTVTSVTHNISAGNFTTTLALVPSNIGAVSNFNENLIMTLENIAKS